VVVAFLRVSCAEYRAVACEHPKGYQSTLGRYRYEFRAPRAGAPPPRVHALNRSAETPAVPFSLVRCFFLAAK
jgi:hypothetical protein